MRINRYSLVRLENTSFEYGSLDELRHDVIPDVHDRSVEVPDLTRCAVNAAANAVAARKMTLFSPFIGCCSPRLPVTSPGRTRIPHLGMRVASGSIARSLRNLPP